MDRWIAFRLCDIYLPDPQQVALRLYGDQVLEGRVIDLSDNGGADGQFVVVELPGFDAPVILPLSCVLSASVAPSRQQRALH